MTTICFDGRYLAADTRGSYGNGGVVQTASHKLSVHHGIAYASTGRIGEQWRAALIEWWCEALGDPRHVPMPAKGLDDNDPGAFIICCPNMAPASLTYATPWPNEHGVPCGWGTGADYAIGAMEMGASAMEAVRIAMRHDSGTGGDIEFIDLEDVERGVQFWQVPKVEYIGNKPPVITKPSKADCDPRDIKLAEPAWWEECTGRLTLGTGCGHCLRCNREWYAIQRENGNPPVTYSIAEPTDGPSLDKLRAVNIAQQAEREAAADARSDRAVVEEWVRRWNGASKGNNKPLMAKLETELRSVKFPPNVELCWERDGEHAHGKQVLKDVTAS